MRGSKETCCRGKCPEPVSSAPCSGLPTHAVARPISPLQAGPAAVALDQEPIPCPPGEQDLVFFVCFHFFSYSPFSAPVSPPSSLSSHLSPDPPLFQYVPLFLQTFLSIRTAAERDNSQRTAIQSKPWWYLRREFPSLAVSGHPTLCQTGGWCCSGICKPCSCEPGSAQSWLKQQQPHCCKGWANSMRRARDVAINSSR